MFTLEQYTPLPRLLDQLADAIAPLLTANGIHWQTLDEEQCRQLALQILNLVPVLWIWDNVEPVAGFPSVADSAWSPAEQRKLADFLRDAANTRAKVLLTSRRDESRWLGELPVRVELPPMPMRERTQLTRALAERHGHRISDVEDWRPLLRYTAGNPLTITVLVGQALREGYTSRADLERFVDRLRAGEGDLNDDRTQGRDRSLAASLSYGFATAFTDIERAQLGVLHLFQDTIDVEALTFMGNRRNPYHVAVLAGLTREAGVDLLDRAADIGLLTALGGGYYAIHPALPWYFRHLQASAGPVELEAAYTAVMAELGDFYINEYSRGRHQVVNALLPEEANLLHARRLARRAGRWSHVISCMQGLAALYTHLGRKAEWARLVNELVPDLVDPATNGPRPGLDLEWSMLTGYLIRIARDARDWATAERLHRSVLPYYQERAAEALNKAPDQLTQEEQMWIRTLAVSEEGLGHIFRDQGRPECVTHYERAATLFRRIGRGREQAVLAFNLGHAYKDVAALRDLDQAEHWYRRALELMDESDLMGRANAMMQFGSMAYERFAEARRAGGRGRAEFDHLQAAIKAYQQALAILPADDVTGLATIHNQLGIIYGLLGATEAALNHYQQSIRYEGRANNRYGAGQSRFNIAVLMSQHDRIGEALLYARAAMRDFEAYGTAAAEAVERVRHFIGELSDDDSATA
ncbi:MULTISPECIES: tetratricopeptide repeat protein [Micromonospora]|uniref:Tetratricopeptide repeat protein n=1 Tax=Micromonospora solifontis TaxID=2487138 RepID=A0ABX9WIJ2_9ACTN|nr:MULTISPECIES: tetratricopeptide repeat protein [Micromonospora]NES12513.1 tetratricopeptide repeat protein [Micromonospora sp. PPF5-17B]NES36042.1 tetratricopeptide repeat protein [Micromonospora solifontis]NES54602.1 tetratricopeptide repeat protein [Micromonospora sp. PPF5-6]RNL99964.1 tetratricopeptide repeat protein [Micromonospora solifontis]